MTMLNWFRRRMVKRDKPQDLPVVVIEQPKEPTQKPSKPSKPEKPKPKKPIKRG